MLKKSVGFVLASFRPSTSLQRVRLGPSLVVALLAGLFEHSGGVGSEVLKLKLYSVENVFRSMLVP